MADDLSDIQSNILSYIPNSFLVRHLRSDAISETIPSANHSRALLLSTNIQNFSHITQHYLKESPNGLEVITNIHKQFIELVQEHLERTGADMLRHGTDTPLFYWEIPTTETEKTLDGLANIIIFELQQLKQVLRDKFSNQEILINFSFILTEGTLTTFTLGDSQQITDYVYGGPSLYEALECPRYPAEESLILVSQGVMQRIQNDFQVSSIDIIQEDGKHEPTNFFLVNRPLETCRAGELVLQAVDLRKMVRQDHFQSVRDEIRYFIPKCIESYIMNGVEPWGSEIRRVSVAFFCIPLDIQNLHYQEELIKLHETLRIVQANVQSYGGTVYRTYLDNKGANIYIVFGLYPESHADDSVRCILAAHSINTTVGKLGLPIFAGISTGEVLVSICGTYQKDLFLIGESLYTAFILSLRSLNDGSKRIIVDDETKIAAEVKISFHLYKNPVFTGKVAEGIYHEVIYTGTPLPPIHPNPFPELRTHHYNMDYSGLNTMEDKLSSLFMVGRDTEFQSAKQIFLQFLKNPSKPNMLLLVGPYGIGKTLFAKNLMEMINDNAEKMNAFGNRPVVLTSSVNPSSRIGKLNGWRFIMREILDRIALSYGQQKEELLYELLEIEPDLQANIPLLKDILDLDVRLEQEEQVLYTEENHAEVPDYEQRIINKILIVILKRFLGEKVTFGSPEVSGNRNTRDSSNKEGSASLIICLDDIQEHDEMSWNLLSEISRKLQKVFLIGVLRDDEISTRCRKNIEEGMQNLASNPNLVLNKITLDPLKQTDLSNIGKRILGERELSDDLKKFITSKCEGNPLAVINLLETLLKQNMMQAVTGVIFPTESLQRLIKLGELIEIKVPLIRHKLNSVVLDKLSFIQYNVLKVACVIGDTFDMKALVVSNPFHTSLLTYSNLVLSLQELRRIGILDLADKSTKNTAYRFAVPFLRETMYQRIAPFLKRKQHRAVALCCEDQTEGPQRKEERIAYHWKLSEQDPAFRRGKNDNARRVFLLKQINAITSQPVKRGDLILKIGEIDKKSFKTFNKWCSRFMALTQSALKYYHNEREFNEKPVFQTGLIPLKHISTITPVTLEGINTRPDTGEKPGFKIVAAKWEKGSQEIGRREFQFGCHNNDDAEDWQLCIEYMRNKAVYEDFMQNSDSTVLAKAVSKKGNNNTTSNVKGDISSRDKQQNIKIWMNASGQEEDYESREGYLPESSPFNRRTKREGTTTSRNTSPVIGRTEGREGMNIAKRQKNKEVLKTFLNKGQIVLWSYLCNAPFKTSLKGKGFGKNPALLLTKPELMRIDPDLVRPEPNLDVSISRRDNSSPKLPYGLDKAITEKLTTYDKARIDVKPNPQTKTGFSALPPSFWAQKTYSGFDDTVDDSSRSIVLGEKVLEDLSYSKRSITPERKKGSVLPGVTYKDENCSVMVEEVTKSQQLLQAKPKIVDMSLLSRREGKSSLTTQVSFGIKGRRDLSKPNIYGRYEFVPTFFVDSYMDDKVVASKNNMVKRVESKVRKVTKRNIPNNASMVLNRKYEDGEEVYIMHEESHERIKNHHQRKTIQASRLEDEAPVYRSPSKIVQDFTHEEYSMSAGNRSFVDERVDHILDKIGGGGYTGETVKQSHNIYTNAGSLYSGHDFGLQKSSMGHVRYKSDISGVQMYPSDNSKSFDLKDSARLTPIKSRMDDLSGFVMNRPGKAEEERRSAYLGASPISQNQSILSDTGFRQTPNILSMSARKDQLDMYSRPANLYSEFQTRGDTSYREITRTPPRDFAKEENLNDRLSDLKIYNANTSTAAGESPLDRIRPTPTPSLTPVEHLLKTYPVLNQDIPPRMSSNIGEDLGISPMKDFSTINRPIPQSTNLPYTGIDSATIRYNKPEEPQFRAPVSNNYSVPLESVTLTQSQPVFKPPFSMQTPNQGLSNSIRFNSGQSSVSFASPNMDPRLQKISPASNERTSITVNPPKGNINPTEFFCMGYIRRETVSQDGDYFSLAPRECVVVTRVYEKRALVEILWNGLSGLFPLSDVELVPPGDPREVERQIVLGTYEEAANRSQNYFVGYNQTGREEVKNTRNASPIMYRDVDIDMSAPRFGSSVDYGAQSPSTPLSGSKMPSKMMMRQMKKMQDSRSSQLHEDSGFMKMGSNI